MIKVIVELTRDIKQSLRKPIGYLVYDRCGENHYFEDKQESLYFAYGQMQGDDSHDPIDKWEIYPLYAAKPRIVK